MTERTVLTSVLIATVHPNTGQRQAWLDSQIADLQLQVGLASCCEVLLLGTIPLEEELPAVRDVVAGDPGLWRHVHFATDPGLYAMWNEGWRRAAGTFIAVLNLDDRYRHDALQFKTQYMLAHPECDVLSCEVTPTSNAAAAHADVRGARWFTSGDRANRHAFFDDGEQTFARAVTYAGGRTRGIRIHEQNPPHNAPFWRRDLFSWVSQGGALEGTAQVGPAHPALPSRPGDSDGGPADAWAVRPCPGEDGAHVAVLFRCRAPPCPAGAFRVHLDPLSDTDLWFRAAVQGAGSCHVSEGLQTYFINPSSHNRRNESRQKAHAALMGAELKPLVPLRVALLADRALLDGADGAGHAAGRAVALLLDELAVEGRVTEAVPLSCQPGRGCEEDGPAGPAASARANGSAPLADVAIVAAAPRWQCAEVRSALGVAARAAVGTARVALLLPVHGARLEEHVCVGQEGLRPAEQASLLAVWGATLGAAPIGSGAHPGGRKAARAASEKPPPPAARAVAALLHFPELRRAGALHMHACVRSVSAAPERDLLAWRNGTHRRTR